MMKKIVFLFLVTTLGFSLFSSTGTALDADESVSRFRDLVFQQELSDPQLEEAFNQLTGSLERLELTGRESSFYKALSFYWMGRSLQAFDSIDTVLAHDREMRKGKFISLQEYYDHPEEAAAYYESALVHISNCLEREETAEYYRLFAEIQGQLVLLKSFGYLISEGPEVKRAMRKGGRLDPENRKILIMEGAGKIYVPPIYGGSTRKGRKMLLEILNLSGLDREDYFNIYTGIGYSLIKEDEKEEALLWLEKAGQIYSGNIYLAALMVLAGS